jgi:hypothetical protein
MKHTIGFFAPKGGLGVTTIAAAVAVIASRTQPVTLHGDEDAFTVLGLPLPADGADTVAASDRLTVTTQPFDPTSSSDGLTIIDDPTFGSTLELDVTYMVMRACFVALRHGQQSIRRPSGLVVIHEHGRALVPNHVGEALGLPVSASVPWSIARAIDAGTLLLRVPRLLDKSLRDIVPKHVKELT